MLKRTTHAAIAVALVSGALVVTATSSGAAASDAVASGAVTATGGVAGPTVRTDKGVVRGSAEGTVRSFAGIPYAAAPVGDLRWAPTAPAPRWRGVRDATRPGSPCPQTGLVPPVGPHSDSEDCLYVNVTAPRASSPRPRPVMVYLHGGDHTDGEGAMNGAARLAAQGDVVVVTVNYRLGALGYLAHPDLEKKGGESGNYGFLDQQAALRWVRHNAAAFGGDPGNVTLFGQSAGATSTCAHLVAPTSAGLFHRAILQSGACTRADATADRADALRQGEATARDIEETHGIDDWREASPEQLVHPFGTGPHYGPVYGGALLPRTPQQALASGEFNRVPVLQGITRDENLAFAYNMELMKRRSTGDPDAVLDERDYRTRLDADFGEEQARAIAAEYPIGAHDGSPALALGAALTDADHGRATVATGEALARHVPTYTYEFADDPTPWYADPAYPEPSFPAGAMHTFELPYLFELAAHRPLDARQRALSAAMIDVWSGFARTGRAPWKPGTGSALNAQSLASGPGGIRPVDFAKEHHDSFWKALG
ncbi:MULTISPECIES: carboxylesterase/lipase family protein [unclassified Streptomyces]|uniref:carboxylesterase/lipase family protein n=1 Tax=unclassified Streptomyces TaxID=2593676 RepID=UPI00278C0CAE|nr:MULTISPECIES: carboxylesterase family protein [unclassified Streptomyces]